MIGYVDTAYGSRAPSAVAGDVSVYAGWGSQDPTLAMDGIFFDNQASGANYISQYAGYAAQVRGTAGFAGQIVGFSPGGICNPAYVDMADFIVIFNQASSVVEGDIGGWYSGFISNLSASQLSKISWIMVGADSTTTKALTNVQAAFNSLYLFATDMTGWQSFTYAPSPSLLNKFLNIINNPITGAIQIGMV